MPSRQYRNRNEGGGIKRKLSEKMRSNHEWSGRGREDGVSVRFMGRWSRAVGALFLNWVVPPKHDPLAIDFNNGAAYERDVGCIIGHSGLIPAAKITERQRSNSSLRKSPFRMVSYRQA